MNRNKINQEWRLLALKCLSSLILIASSPNNIFAAIGPAINPPELRDINHHKTKTITRDKVEQKKINLFEFEITYELKAFGLSGETKINLSKISNNYYQYKSTTQAKGLASVIRPNAATEISRFQIRDSEILVEEYLFSSGASKKQEDSYLRFDWQKQIAFGNHQGELRKIPLYEGVLDRISTDLKVILDLEAGNSPSDYSMVHRNQIKTYSFNKISTESIETKAGTFQAIKYVRKREGSARSAYIWYAPELDYQPIKVVQFKKGKVQATLLLENYKTQKLSEL